MSGEPGLRLLFIVAAESGGGVGALPDVGVYGENAFESVDGVAGMEANARRDGPEYVGYGEGGESTDDSVSS